MNSNSIHILVLACMLPFASAASAALSVNTYPGFEGLADKLPTHIDGGVTLKAAVDSLVCVGTMGMSPGLVLSNTQTIDTMKFKSQDWQTQYRSYIDIGICDAVDPGQEFKVIQLQTTCLVPWVTADKRHLQSAGQHCFYSPIVEYKGGKYMLPENALIGLREFAVERLTPLLKPQVPVETPQQDLVKLLESAPTPVITEPAADPF